MEEPLFDRNQGAAARARAQLHAAELDSYRAGQGGIVELLDALDAITDARLHQLDLIAAALDAQLDVRAAASGR